MQSTDWNIYRHSRFLQSLKITKSEHKYLRLFLKRSNFENEENVENTQKNTVKILAEV